MSGYRLPDGGRIDRARPIRFRWAGRELTGFAGDSLASALLANGVSIVGRSFKLHRPRGLLAAGLEEPNAIVQLGVGPQSVPNLKATQIELHEGLEAAPVNVWPSADVDLLAINSLFKRFLPAAFYYKTFIWPGWRWFEPLIRRAAGLGVVPPEPDPDSYEGRYAHVDLLVVGGGAAGIAAALAGAATGASVMLVEGDGECGGGFLAGRPTVDGATIDGQPAEQWLQEAIADLRHRPTVTLLTRTLAFGYYDHNLVGLCQRDPGSPFRERLWRVRAGRVILATGAFERPLPFVNNDLPGVMLASAAKTYALRYGVAPGRRLVVATNNDSAYAAAFALQDAGATIVAIVDSREGERAVVREAGARSLPVIAGAAPLKAIGRRALRAVIVAPVAASGPRRTITCDALLVSGGWNPAVHLHSQSGGSLRFDAGAQAFMPANPAQPSICVGAAAGLFASGEAIAHARATVSGAPATVSAAPDVGPVRELTDGDASAHAVWLDYQNDVTVGDVQLAVRENYRSVEHVKRYTTLGMASDQGKTSNVAAIQILSGLLGKAPDAVGTTKFRPPFDPVTIGTLAGRNVGVELMPAARLCAHGRQVALGARMEQYGGWLRPACFAQPDESEAEAVAREVLAVRGGVGLFEASPLGKIEVKGPDAAAFLNRMYVNTLSTLRPGRCRYAIMLTEAGAVFDDGVIARRGADHFIVGTTSARAVAVADAFEEWLQCEWPQLRVLTDRVTTGWAVMNVAGRRARQVLEAVGSSIDLAPGAFPHMSYREGEVGGVPARVQRVSFTGELSFEVAVPWRCGPALWDAILAAGAPLGIVPFGVEALMAMRIEKGFLHVGVDTDGTTLPQDIGLGDIVATKACDFVGRRSTIRPDGLRDDRRQLVGLEVEDGGGAIPTGAHVLPPGCDTGTDGWVTSSVLSPTLRRPVALALVRRGRARIGEPVRVWNLGEVRHARIAKPRFHDPEGARLHG